jgi:hypothetical protein
MLEIPCIASEVVQVWPGTSDLNYPGSLPPLESAPTRFPQRIKVAAWALHQEKAFGRFVIEHDRDSGTATMTWDD